MTFSAALWRLTSAIESQSGDAIADRRPAPGKSAENPANWVLVDFSTSRTTRLPLAIVSLQFGLARLGLCLSNEVAIDAS